MIYLASPYTGSKELQRFRYVRNLEAVAGMIKNGYLVFSPILHFHEVARIYDLPKDFMFWCTYNFEMLSKVDALYVLTLDGYKQSEGVKAEVAFALKREIPTFLYHMYTKQTERLKTIWS